MEINELIPGKWYKTLEYKEYYYRFIKIEDSSSIRADYIAEGKLQGENRYISNNRFWANGREATEEEISNISHLIPEEFEKQQHCEYLIYN